MTENDVEAAFSRPTAEASFGTPRSTWTLVAGSVPLVAYVATASGHGYWLDAGELVAASVDLGIAHPPGEPLATLAHHAATWIPLGPIAFRVAIVSSVAGAAAVGVAFLAMLRTLLALGVPERPLARLLALGGSWWMAASPAYWLQAVRPEVYALQALLVFVCIERLVAIEQAVPEIRARPLYTASLAFGLALANHHFLALLVLPAAAPSVGRIVARRGARPFWLGAGFAALGAAIFVYLPLRALDRPFLDLGHPTSIDRFWWVLSAQAFQKNQGGGVPGSIGDRMMEVVIHLATSLHPVTIFVALAGAYVLLRAREGRRLGALWAAVLLVVALARAWLGFLRENPDALGYLMPAFAAIAAMAVSFVAVFATLLADRRRRVATTLAALLPLGSLGMLIRGADDASLATFVATEIADDGIARDLPTRAAVLVFDPQTVFRFWSARVVDGARPDVSMVPIPFLGYPRLASQLTDEDPSLAPVVRDELLEGAIGEAAIESLAGERPTLVELDVRVRPELYGALAPSGYYHRVLAGGSTDTDVESGGGVEDAYWTATERRLGSATDAETRRWRLWRHYQRALFFAGRGSVARARAAVEAAMRFAPGERTLSALRGALEHAEGPIDVTPFMTGP